MDAKMKKQIKLDDKSWKETILPDNLFDLQEIETSLLMERKQMKDYNFYYYLSLAGFYLSLLLFVWHVL